MLPDMPTLLTTALGALLGALALTSCSGVPVAPAYTQEELAARCARTGGWWRDSGPYSLVSGHCEYRD
jgi:hypothetical protein